MSGKYDFGEKHSDIFQVLLIKFASAFVPFMEELHGYHPGLEVAFAAPLSQKLNIDGKDKVTEQTI